MGQHEQIGKEIAFVEDASRGTGKTEVASRNAITEQNNRPRSIVLVRNPAQALNLWALFVDDFCPFSRAGILIFFGVD